MPVELKKFDVSKYIQTPEDQTGYMAAVLEERDARLLAPALGQIAKARGKAKFARESGISRDTIYKQFRPGGNPRLDTIDKAMSALGLELRFSAAPKQGAVQS